jgi:hypothetical protein
VVEDPAAVGSGGIAGDRAPAHDERPAEVQRVEPVVDSATLGTGRVPRQDRVAHHRVIARVHAAATGRGHVPGEEIARQRRVPVLVDRAALGGVVRGEDVVGRGQAVVVVDGPADLGRIGEERGPGHGQPGAGRIKDGDRSASCGVVAGEGAVGHRDFTVVVQGAASAGGGVAGEVAAGYRLRPVLGIHRTATQGAVISEGAIGHVRVPAGKDGPAFPASVIREPCPIHAERCEKGAADGGGVAGECPALYREGALHEIDSRVAIADIKVAGRQGPDC